MMNNELFHFGIKNMRWGVRRWQNYDGTFNEAGKKRYFRKKDRNSSSDETQTHTKERKLNNIRLDKSKNIADTLNNTVNSLGRSYANKKRNSISNNINPSQMSTKELQDAVNRMNLEENYIRLMANKAVRDAGEDRVEKAIKSIGTIASSSAAILGMAVTLKNLLN